MGSRQWVTKVEGITPEAAPKICELVNNVPGVVQGSAFARADYVAFQTTAAPGDPMEHSRVGAEVTSLLKAQKNLRVGLSTTGPQ
jgi:hypothetical protein